MGALVGIVYWASVMPLAVVSATAVARSPEQWLPSHEPVATATATVLPSVSRETTPPPGTAYGCHVNPPSVVWRTPAPNTQPTSGDAIRISVREVRVPTLPLDVRPGVSTSWPKVATARQDLPLSSERTTWVQAWPLQLVMPSPNRVLLSAWETETRRKSAGTPTVTGRLVAVLVGAEVEVPAGEVADPVGVELSEVLVEPVREPGSAVVPSPGRRR